MSANHRELDQAAAKTTADPTAPRQSIPESRWIRFAHLFALSGFAVAQPLLERISQHTPYLIDLQFNSVRVLVLTAAVMLLVPVGLFGIVELIGCRSRRVRFAAHKAAIGILAFLIALSISRVFLSRQPLMGAGIPWVVPFVVALICALVFVQLYARRKLLQQVLTISALGVAAFPSQFLLASPVKKLVFPPPPEADRTVRVERPVPIVMVVFDEFNGLTLLDKEGRIDAARFPNFDRLSRETLWFRNATASHHRTERALPSMLTGSYVPSSLPSTELEFPDNLFALIKRSGKYETRAFEPFTRLCTPDAPPEQIPVVDAAQATLETADTLSKVYVNALLTTDSPLTPQIPRSWFQMGDTGPRVYLDGPNVRRFPWDKRRTEQLDEFLKTLHRSDAPTFHFLHIALPHNPWMYLPSGKTYDPRICYPMDSPGFVGPEHWIDDDLAVLQSWVRHDWQLQFMDRFIGELMETLRDRGLWDDSLLVVVADHGASFVPHQPRRQPVPENAPEIASVPLFIKLPADRPVIQGGITDRNVETIDILPSMADVIGMELPSPVDGVSVFDVARPERPRKTLQGDGDMMVFRPNFPEGRTALEQLHRRFAPDGPERADHDLPKWNGRQLSGMTISDQPPRPMILTMGGDVAAEEVVPCCLDGYVGDFQTGSAPIVIAISLNGRIEAVTRTYRDQHAEDAWAATIREEAYLPGKNNLEIFEVLDVPGNTLRRCTWEKIDNW